MRILQSPALAVLTLLLCNISAAENTTPTRVSFNIPQQSLGDALTEWSRQSGLQVLRRERAAAAELTSGTVSGEFSPEEALNRLLQKTGLGYEFVNERTVRITGAHGRTDAASAADPSIAEPLRLVRAQADAEDHASGQQARALSEAGAVAGNDQQKGIPEILVKGARSSNTDIRRTEDDVQPYVVFDAEEIGNSMAPDLETFLKTRLPMNQARTSHSQKLTVWNGNQSAINLRGLGADQTLILVNGRRLPGAADFTDILQPDINGIPIAAVQRIEILPSTAGGIYGGGATGGVVNIILKRDYSELELNARYDGTFAGGGAERRLDATGGFTLGDGRTSVMVMASYRDGNPLYIGDRDFSLRSRRLQQANDSDAFVGSIRPLRGYTTNIRSVSGNDLELLDGRSLNEPIAHVPVGYAGPASDNGAAFLTTAGRYNLALPEDVTGNQYPLLSAPTVRSLAVNLRREFTDRIEVFVDASRYDNRAVRAGSYTAAGGSSVTLPVGVNNPFTEEVTLSIPLAGYEANGLRTSFESLTEQLSGGVIVRLPHQWMVQGEYNWSRSNSILDYPVEFLSADGRAALIDGRLNSLSDVNVYPLDFSSYYPDQTGQNNSYGSEYPAVYKNATLRMAGPLLNLPGGPLRLAAVLEERQQYTGNRVSTDYYPTLANPTVHTYYPEIGSTTESMYAELTAPLVSAANARRGLLALDLQASYRYDATRTRTREVSGSSVEVPSTDGPFPEVPFQANKVTGNQYTLGMRYTPVESLALRVSYGEGILPPTPQQLAENPFPTSFLAFLGYIDPMRGGTVITDATVEKFMPIQGSLLLRPERSQSWSAGAIFTPAILPGLRMSLDYTRIEKVDEISALSMRVIIDLEDSFPGRIVRNPLTPEDEALGYTGGTIRELNGGNVNIAHSLVEALDIQVDYSWETQFGAFAVNAIATVQPHLQQQAAPDSEVFDIVGYNDGPLKWRASAGLRWSRGPWDLGWNLQYYDASRVYTSTASDISRDITVLGQGSAWIPTQTYQDVYGRYRFESLSGFGHRLLDNAEMQISVQNIFDARPPILASAAPDLVAGYATEGDARLRRYSITFTKRFGL